jgi:hypothetical protein
MDTKKRKPPPFMITAGPRIVFLRDFHEICRIANTIFDFIRADGFNTPPFRARLLILG